MDIDIDVYFWMVDRGVFDDDHRNHIDMDRNKVKLHREHSQKFENAIYISQLMLILKKSVVKISKKPFSVDPNLQNLKDNGTAQTKTANWNLVQKELKKFGVRVSNDQKQKIIDGRVQFIGEILNKLFDFDNGGGVSSGRYQDGNMSEINYGSNEVETSFLIPPRPQRDESADLSIDIRESQVKLALPSKKQQLEPIDVSQLQGQQAQQNKARGKGSAVTSVQQSNVLTEVPSMQNLQKQSNQKSKMSLYDPLQELNDEKDLSECQSTLEFILLSLSKSLQMKPKQAALLLSDQHKYLIHIVVKGLKGGDFTKILHWYQDLYSYTQVLINLIEQEKDLSPTTMSQSLNIIKCGLYSSNVDIAIACARVLSKIIIDIKEQGGGQMYGMAWEWFISTQSTSVSPHNNIQDSIQKDGIDNDAQQSQQASSSIDSGLSSVLYAVRRHPQEFKEHAISMMSAFGTNHNYYELLTHHLQVHLGAEGQEGNLTNNSNSNKTIMEYMETVMDFIYALGGLSTQMSKDMMVNSGVIDYWIEYAIRFSDFDGINPPELRATALSFLCLLWNYLPEKIQEKGDVAQAILTMFKRGCRDKSRNLRTVCCEMMFQMLENFAQERNSFAPILYKSLTFLLIEFYTDLEIREAMMKHFSKIYTQFPSIPVAILCEPLIKQIQITESSQLSFQKFNTFDYEFFMTVVRHKRANSSIILQIAEEMIKVAQIDIFYSGCAIGVAINIIQKLEKDPQMHQCFSHLFKQSLKVIEDQERQSAQFNSKNSQNQSKQNSPPQKASLNKYTLKRLEEEQKRKKEEENQIVEASKLAMKSKERLIVQMFKKIIELSGNDMIKEDIRVKLLQSYIVIEKSCKVQSKAIQYLLKMFTTDIPQMLQYFIDYEQPKIKEEESQQQDQLPPTDILVLKSDANSDSLNHRVHDIALTNEITEQSIVPYSQTNNNNNNNNTETIRQKNQKRWDRQKEQAMKDIEKVKTIKMGRTEKRNLEEEVKKLRQEKQNFEAKKKVIQRREELGIENKVLTLDKNTRDIQPMGNEVVIRSIMADYEDEEDNQRLMIYDQEQPSSSTILQKRASLPFDKTEIKLYDIRIEEQKDQDAVRFFIKKNLKIFKNLFSKYSQSGSKAEANAKTFEQMQNKLGLITVAEMIKMLKDFGINNTHISKDDIMTYFRLINMEILKKGSKSSSIANKATLSVLDFEGFVEFFLQLSVYIYSFSDDNMPVVYLQNLLDHFRKHALQSGHKLAKVLEDPTTATAIGNSEVIKELNRRLESDPNYQLPDGYSKLQEKELVNTYKVPNFIPMYESQRVVIEVLDQYLSDIFGFHFLEPMTEMKMTTRARPNIKFQQQTIQDKDPYQQNQLQQRYMRPLREDSRNRKKNQKAKLSISVDSGVGTMGRGSKNVQSAQSLRVRNLSPNLKEIKPKLGVHLQIEVAKSTAQNRSHVLETAYVFEEMLQAVEKGLFYLPERQQLSKQKIINKAIEQRMQKQNNEIKQKQDQKNKMDQRREELKQQLEKMREEKEKKMIELEEQRKKQQLEEKKKQDKKEQARQKMYMEINSKNGIKKQEKQDESARENENKIKEEQQKKEQRKREVSEAMRKKKMEMKENFKKQSEENKKKQEEQELEKRKKEEVDKQQHEKIKQKLSVENQKIKDQIFKVKQNFFQFLMSPEVVDLFSTYQKPLQNLFDTATKYEKNFQTGQLSYTAFVKMGQLTQLVPKIISSSDFIYAYKTIMKAKKDQFWQVEQDQDSAEGTKINYREFLEVMVKVCCLGRFKLGGLKGSEEEFKEKEQRMKQRQKGQQIDLEFDTNEITTQTIVNMFTFLKMKGAKVQKQKGDNNNNNGGDNGQNQEYQQQNEEGMQDGDQQQQQQQIVEGDQ